MAPLDWLAGGRASGLSALGAIEAEWGWRADVRVRCWCYLIAGRLTWPPIEMEQLRSADDDDADDDTREIRRSDSSLASRELARAGARAGGLTGAASGSSGLCA